MIYLSFANKVERNPSKVSKIVSLFKVKIRE